MRASNQRCLHVLVATRCQYQWGEGGVWWGGPQVNKLEQVSNGGR